MSPYLFEVMDKAFQKYKLKETISKFNFLNFKDFRLAKYSIKNLQAQATNLQQTYATHKTDEESLKRIHKEFLKKSIYKNLS